MTAGRASHNGITRWAPVVAWAAVIFLMSSRPGSTLPGGFSVGGHVTEYFIFGVLLFRAFRCRHAASTALALALVVGSVYGITDEFHQNFVAMRTPDVTDWGLDTVGTFAGAVAAHFAMEWRARRAERTP